MSRDQLIGTLLIAVSIIAIAVYLWLLFFPPIIGIDFILIKITAAIAIATIFGILGWIGYTLATTPPPKPIEEIEKEIEEELKKLEQSPTTTQPTK
uniref:Transcriptional regulator n=1 Tax=Ignisphaera aggregans TaxID=334771 RepID=A0A7C5XJN8_9CREN